MVEAATAKLREPKNVRTRGTDSKLESDERKLRDGSRLFWASVRSRTLAPLPGTKDVVLEDCPRPRRQLEDKKLLALALASTLKLC